MLSTRPRLWGAIAAAFLVLQGCGGCEELYAGGTVVLNGPERVVAGQPFTVDIGGSKIDGQPACPDTVRATISGTSLSGAVIENAAGNRSDALGEGSRPLPTDGGSPCRVAAGTRVMLTAGPAPTIGERSAQIIVRVIASGKLKDTGESAIVDGTKPITIVTPDPAEPPPPPPPANEKPLLDVFAVDDPGVQGEPLEVDARLSRDPEGKPLAYAFDPENDGTFVGDADGLFVVEGGRTAGGDLQIGVAVGDAQGAITQKVETYEIGPPGTARPVVRRPSSYTVGQEAVFRPEALQGADQVRFAVDKPLDDEFDSDDGVQEIDAPDGEKAFRHTFATPGLHRVAFSFIDTEEDDNVSTQRFLVDVRSASARAAQRARAARRFRARTTVRITSSLVSRGELTAKLGVLRLKGALLRGTMRIAAPAKRKGVRRPRVLSKLDGGRFVARLKGALGAPLGKDFAFKGNATMLVRGMVDRRLLACARLRTDSLNRRGNRLAFLGGTRGASRFLATARLAPFLLGPDDLKRKASGSGRLTVADARKPTPLPKACRRLRSRLR